MVILGKCLVMKHKAQGSFELENGATSAPSCFVRHSDLRCPPVNRAITAVIVPPKQAFNIQNLIAHFTRAAPA